MAKITVCFYYLCIVAMAEVMKQNPRRGGSRFFRLKGGSSPLSPPPGKVYRFPDGSSYHGQIENGRICGKGEWRSSEGDLYRGEFKNDVFHGQGQYEDTKGNRYIGAFTNGQMHGIGSYTYHDGRTDICKYSEGRETGEGVRFSSDRTQAWRLENGNVARPIDLSEASMIANRLDLSPPPSIFELSHDAKERLSRNLAVNADGTSPSFHSYLTNLHEYDCGLIAQSTSPVLDDRACDAIVAEAEARARQYGGWASSRHENYPTTDVPLQRLPRAKEYFVERILPDFAYPFIQKAFGPLLKDIAPNSANSLDSSLCPLFRVVDCFVVKYNATSGQRELTEHRDGSIFSFNVALNGLEEYTGGGTSFRALKWSDETKFKSEEDSAYTLKLPKGHILAHSSALMHAGHPIKSGVRYILVAFLSVEPRHTEWGKGLYEGIRIRDEAHIKANELAASRQGK